jgi:hypothetical protein
MTYDLPAELRSRLCELARRLERLQPSSDPGRFVEEKGEILGALRRLAGAVPMRAQRDGRIRAWRAP